MTTAMLKSRSTAGFLLGLAVTAPAHAQSPPEENRATPPQERVQDRTTTPGPGHEIGSGAGNIGTGAAKGAGNLAKGTGKGAAELVTLHPINAATSFGKGAAVAGKDVTVGTAKGTGKIAQGIGRAFKKLF
jgi:hypothetical protein